MKLSILTTITNPIERQDRWQEAMRCYLDLADEVIIVNGGELITKELKQNLHEKIKFVNLPWPDEWNWIELPRHLNAGLKQCTGDWVIKLDIDQFIHEKDFEKIRSAFRRCPADCDVVTFQKMSMTYGKRFYQKGGQPIAFRNKPGIKIGKNKNKLTDLCFAVKQTGVEVVEGYKMPVGEQLKEWKSGITYWNFDYFFKTKEFTRKEFVRFSRAYNRYFGKWTFGRTEAKAFRVFLNMMKGRYERCPYEYRVEDLPKYIHKAVKDLKPEQFGYNGWGLCEL
jgi:hypothetical protein